MNRKPVVFETLREDLAFLDLHLDRLFDSVSLLGMSLSSSIDRASLEVALQKAVASIRKPSRVKLRVSEQDFEVVISPFMPWNQPITVASYVYDRPHPKAKYETDHYRLMREKASQLGVDELIYTDGAGFIREGSVSNVFLQFGDTLVTPQEGILLGIMRQQFMAEALGKGWHVKEREIHQSEIEKADEIWVTNSLQGVVKVGWWDEKNVISTG